MSFEVHCDKCGARFTLTADLYERKVRGRVVTVRCRKCRADITVDGSDLGSLLPQPPHEETPTVPLTGPGLPPVGGLWVVSFGDEDDRELTAAQIKASLEAGDIDPDTLVWNTSMDEWLAISDVPELAKLLGKEASDTTGGFLGTGVEIGGAKASTPPPLPSEEKADLDEDEVGPFKSVAAGTIFVEEEGKAKEGGPATPRSATDNEAPTDSAPVSKRKKRGKKKKKAAAAPAPQKSAQPTQAEAPAKSDDGAKASETTGEAKAPKPPPKPERKLPKAPAKLKPDWAQDKPPAKPAADDEEEAPPSSRTPALTALTASMIPGKKENEESSSPTSSDEIYAIGGGAITTSLAPVDLSRIPDEPPPSSIEAVPLSEEPEPVSSEAPEKPKKAKKKPPERKPPRSPSSRERSKAVTEARPAEEEKSGSMLTWLLLGGAALVGVWYFFLRSPGNTEGPATTPTTTAATAEPTTTAEPTAEPTTTAAPTSEPSAAPTTTDTSKPELTKPETTKPELTKPELTKPETTQPETTKPETTKPETTKPETTKPEASAAPTGEVAMAPPFDANAAKAALASAAAAASGCRQEGDPVGTATVIVTFAPSGRVTTANVSGPPFAGTKTGGCIAARMRGAKIPAFSGSHVTVSKTIVIQ